MIASILQRASYFVTDIFSSEKEFFDLKFLEFFLLAYNIVKERVKLSNKGQKY